MDEFAIQNKVLYCTSSIQWIQQLHGKKVIALTRRGLTRVPGKRDGISHRNKFASDGRLNCKNSAEVIVVLLE
jgi:hypothetical protein